jgi:hypothetical protein
MFSPNGKNLMSFISVIPTDTTNPILMLHGLDGNPTHYNKTDVSTVFEFLADGRLHRFYENVVIPIYDATGVPTHELYVTFEDLFGIKSPMLKLKNLATNTTVTGLLDIDYDGRYSGSYNVMTTPFEEQSYYLVTNITKMVITADIPVLPNLTIKYEIPSGVTISVVATPQSDYYIRKSMDLDSLRYRFVDLGTPAEEATKNIITFIGTPPTEAQVSSLMGFAVENFSTVSTFDSSQVSFTNSAFVFLGFVDELPLADNIRDIELLCLGLAENGLKDLPQLKTVILPECDSVIDLGFSGSSVLKNITAPKLATIGTTSGNDGIFTGCTNLLELVVASSLETDPLDGDLDYAINTLGTEVTYE